MLPPGHGPLRWETRLGAVVGLTERPAPAAIPSYFMFSPDADKAPDLLPELGEFAACLQQGVHEALEYLNSRTPHRYTGLFRFDGEVLHSEALFDRNQPSVQQGLDAPLATTYCALVGRQQVPLHILDAAADPRLQLVQNLVVSYCGVLMRDAQGHPYGTLCHYDLQRCQERTTDVPLLEAAAALFYQRLHVR